MSDLVTHDGSAGPSPAEPPAVTTEPSRRRRGFRDWRRRRPFWGGLLIILGGLEIGLTILAPLPILMHIGWQGTLGYLFPLIIILCGLLIIITPSQRLFNSCVAALLGLATWLTSNLGGFVIGMLLTLVGAAMAFSWGIQRPKVPRQRQE